MAFPLNYWGNQSLRWGLPGSLGFEYTPVPEKPAAKPESALKRWLMQEGETEPEGPVEPKPLSWGMDKAIDNLGALEVLQSPVVSLASLALPPPVSIPFWAARKGTEYYLANEALKELGSDYSPTSAVRNLVPLVGNNQELIRERIGDIMRTVPNAPGSYQFVRGYVPTSASELSEAIENSARQDLMQSPGYQDVGGPGRLDAPDGSIEQQPPSATPDLGMDAWGWGGGGWF
jgi:hypothetical protein